MDLNKLASVYDKFAESYDAKRDSFNIDEIINQFRQQLTDKGHLLDLGCGAGIPVGRSFVDNGWNVSGVDFSSKMLELAARHVPEMKTICSDISSVNFSDEEFSAISLIYSIFHIPKDLHSELFAKIYRWLSPGGKVLFTYATQEYTGSKEFSGYKEFLGQQLYYSHDTPELLFDLLQDIGFVIESNEYHCIADETFLWVTVKKLE